MSAGKGRGLRGAVLHVDWSADGRLVQASDDAGFLKFFETSGDRAGEEVCACPCAATAAAAAATAPAAAAAAASTATAADAADTAAATASAATAATGGTDTCLRTPNGWSRPSEDDAGMCVACFRRVVLR